MCLLDKINHHCDKWILAYGLLGLIIVMYLGN